MSEDIFLDTFGGGFGLDETLASWVMNKCNDWRDHYEANYRDRHEEYMRLYRNQWAAEDKSRESERSKLIAPALSQAVESNVAELEEATFGRGKIFDIKDDVAGQDPRQVAYLRDKLHEDFALTRLRSSIAEVLINAAVYGTGIGEVVLEEVKIAAPATRPMADLPGANEIGVEETVRPVVKINPVQPQNFLIDPAATSVDEAIGCAVDEFVTRHVVEELQESGVYRDEELAGNAAADEAIEFDGEVETVAKDRVRLTKYYGKVPRDLLISEGVSPSELGDNFYVEALVVLANEGQVLKAQPNPYMCQDRPIVAFQWDIVPNIFWGRGVCEKGYMSQKALDAELRSHIDALALTTAPMLAVDAARIPRGHKLEVRPGRMLLTNGNPGDAIQPFNFGQLSGANFQQGAILQQMVSQATGSGDGSQPTVQNDVTAAGMSMSQGAIVKRQKRTLVNFEENFLIPYVRKAAYRYMQFDPNNYPVQDYTFVAFSSLGAMAREYEVAQLSQMLQMIPPESPAHGAIIKGIVDHLNVSNREEIMMAIEQANQPDPAAQQAQQQQMESQKAITDGQVNLLNAQSAESQSRAEKYRMEAQLMPDEMALKYAEDQEEKEFQRKAKMGELLVKEDANNIQRKKMEMDTQKDLETNLLNTALAGLDGMNADG